MRRGGVWCRGVCLLPDTTTLSRRPRLSEGSGGDDGGVAGQSVLLATLYYGGLLGLLAALVAWLVLPAAVCAQAASSAVLAPGPASAMDANGAAPAFGA